MESLKDIQNAIHACTSCKRLRKHCLETARVKRRAYMNEEYWARPVSGFGDPNARLMMVGLAPAAHGANRTGRMFTGDRSGEWLYRALHKAGFANQPQALHVEDGLELKDAYITSVVKCAPPDNKPEPEEIEACQSHLLRELEALKQVRVFLVLGQIALKGLWPYLKKNEVEKSKGRRVSRPEFAHGREMKLADGRYLLMSFHPSQQNTFTGKLTEPMFDRIFARARELIAL